MRVTDGNGHSEVVCDGATGSTGATGATGATGSTGVTGQNGITVTGNPTTLTTLGTAVALFSTSFTVPSMTSFVFVTTDGEFASAAAIPPSEIIVDFDLVIDGARYTYRRQFIRDDVGGFGNASLRGQWSFSTMVTGLVTGASHNVTLYASLAGTSPAGGSATVCQTVAGPGCRLNILVLNR